MSCICSHLDFSQRYLYYCHKMYIAKPIHVLVTPELFLFLQHLRTAYDIAVAREYFDIATCVDGTMMPADARALYGKSVGIIYGVGCLL